MQPGHHEPRPVAEGLRQQRDQNAGNADDDARIPVRRLEAKRQKGDHADVENRR